MKKEEIINKIMEEIGDNPTVIELAQKYKEIVKTEIDAEAEAHILHQCIIRVYWKI